MGGGDVWFLGVKSSAAALLVQPWKFILKRGGLPPPSVFCSVQASMDWMRPICSGEDHRLDEHPGGVFNLGISSATQVDALDNHHCFLPFIHEIRGMVFDSSVYFLGEGRKHRATGA